MKKNISSLPVESFQIHPEVMKTYREKDLDSLRFTIAKYGQQTPVKVIERDGMMEIVDGVSRFNCAKQLNLTSLIYEVVTVEDNKVMEYRMLSNVKTKRTFTETCLEAEYILDTIGKSQGRKRELLGFDDFTNNDYYGQAGKDRFDLTCALMGIEMKGSTLRKAMRVFELDFNPKGKSKTGTLELLDAGRISIDKGYKLLKDKENKKNRKNKSKNAKMFIAHSNLTGREKPYKLFNKSSLNMEEIPENSLDMDIDSHPYFGLRDYPNQDEMLHGQEPTVEEYIENFKAFNWEKYRKLKPGGVLVTIIGETYRNGYQGVCSRVELALEEIGFKILDVVIWAKSNQRFAPHPFRFQNSYERIIVAYKPGADPFYTDVFRKGSVDDFKVKPTSNLGYYMASPETCIPNVIITPAHNSKVFKEIDPKFTHDAPAPEEVYKIFIEAYSKPGDTILDSFVGSGTIGIGLAMGRKVIGYDVDPLSIEFSQKRFEWYLNQGQEGGQMDDENPLSVAA